MTEAFCRITVLAPHRRVDLAVPADLACAEVLPQVVRLAGEADGRPPPVAWALGRLGEPPLRPERSLAQAGVLDGDTLYLVAADRRPDPVVVDDLVETIADTVDARPGQWTGPAWHRFLVAAGAAVLAAAAGFAAADGAPAAVPVAPVVWVGALALWRARREGFAAAALALAALPWWAVAGAAVADRAAGPAAAAALRVAAAAAGLLAGAVAAAAVPAASAPSLAVAVPAGALAAGAGAVALGAAPAQAAAVLAVALVPLASALPGVAIRLAGIRGGDEDAEVAVDAERTKVAAGHRLLSWLLAGTAVVLAGALVVLAAASSSPARWLAAATAAAVTLRARAFRFVGQVLPLGLAALAGVVTLEVALAGRIPAGPGRQAVGAGLLAATAAGLLAAGFVARGRAASPALRHRLDRVEVLANLSLLPLALAVLGLYTMVERLAQRFSG